jgi:hypothetical protein
VRSSALQARIGVNYSAESLITHMAVNPDLTGQPLPKPVKSAFLHDGKR